jgi:DNA-binding beta-propeller fold protein YncE
LSRPIQAGSGSLRFELIQGWEQAPAGWEHPDVAAVATDAQDNVYLFCRNNPPIWIYDREGRFLDSWGEGQFTNRTHGMFIDGDQLLWLVDDADHTARKYTLDGKLLLTLGTSKVASDTGYTGTVESILRGAPPFNRPTNVVMHPDRSLYASDGYGNCRVHHFSAEGQLLESWGNPGTGHGCFHNPHGIWAHADGRLFVADRENDRIQIFDAAGNYLDEWLDVQRPCDIYMDGKGLIFVSELVKRKGYVSPRLGPTSEQQPSRMSIFDEQGNLLLRWGDLDEGAAGNFVAPHGLWVDSHGDIYVAEVTETIGVRSGYVPRGTHTFQKWARL